MRAGRPVRILGAPRRSRKLLIMFEGGGGCFSYATCAEGSPWFDDSVSQRRRPGRRGRPARLERADNPFRDYSVVFIPVCTGDVHIGDNVHSYAEEEAGHDSPPRARERPRGPLRRSGASGRDHRLRDRLLRRKRRRGLPHAGDLGRYPRAQVTYFGDSLAFVFRRPIDIERDWRGDRVLLPWADVDPRRFTMTRYLAELAHRYPRRTFARFNHAGDAVQEQYLAAGGPPGGFELFPLRGAEETARAHRAELPLLPRLRLGPLRDVRRPLLHPGAGRRPPPRLGRPARAGAQRLVPPLPLDLDSSPDPVGEGPLVDDARGGRVLDGVAGGLVDGELVLRVRPPATPRSPPRARRRRRDPTGARGRRPGTAGRRRVTRRRAARRTRRRDQAPARRDAPTDVTCAPGASHSRLSTRAWPHPAAADDVGAADGLLERRRERARLAGERLRMSVRAARDPHLAERTHRGRRRPVRRRPWTRRRERRGRRRRRGPACGPRPPQRRRSMRP